MIRIILGNQLLLAVFHDILANRLEVEPSYPWFIGSSDSKAVDQEVWLHSQDSVALLIPECR